MSARRCSLAILLVGLAASGCGDQAVAETPEAKHTKKNAEALLKRGGGSFVGGPDEPVSDDLERIDCTGGEQASARGDFTCTAVSETGWKIRCDGQVTNGRVASSGCRFLPRD